MLVKTARCVVIRNAAPELRIAIGVPDGFSLLSAAAPIEPIRLAERPKRLDAAQSGLRAKLPVCENPREDEAAAVAACASRRNAFHMKIEWVSNHNPQIAMGMK